MMPTPLARTWAQDLWGSPWRAALSLGVFALIAWLLWLLVPWAVLHATFAPDAAACRAHREGACWGVVAEKWRPILFGRYPFDAQWRAALAGLLLVLMTLVSAWPTTTSISPSGRYSLTNSAASS